ncbi:M56 family metallopeptidase [Flagellimonas pacifica]|uniref:Signal transducer regulating beta-lactamase production, contains metallopeptidase domain n=1 Tax=Flagellimonas pacifica TaxID=1247520 RepID=A0A285MVT2_9FLAO|nr:M56 family metallopeptidase [Allomuricauda parva]SNZ01294.1 Signal transducer regulating beta-lactamase production, contains metallopeptidase domain [Allomuricauda parva]
MLTYILKSAACLAILLLFYKVFLERERMHRFKRFYLIGSLIVSLIIPLLVFVESITVTFQQEVNTQNALNAGEIVEAVNTSVPPLDFTSFIWSIYYIGVAFFGFKFFNNLVQIVKRIRTNPRKRYKNHTKVLLEEKMPPHTFFHFIFLNKSKMESDKIPHEVLVHEEAHATQKHSLDVIFIELLQVVLWFNPLVFLFKKVIKLNHEFLADQEVLSKNIDAVTYQNTLLSFSSIDKQFQPALPNAINYSSIKKRITIMKTKTSKKSVLIRSLLLFPLFSLLLYGFSDKKTITIISDPSTAISEDYPIKIKINTKQEIFVDGKVTKLENLSAALNSILESNDSNNPSKSKVHLEAEGHLNIKLLTAIKKQLSKTKVSLTMIMADSIIINEKDLDATFKGTGFIAKDTFHVKLDDGKTLSGINTPKMQEGASRKQMAEYNHLAKRYNDMPKNNMRISLKDVNRLTYIYNLMSEKQRKDAEPFPNFPEPPQQSATREQMAEYNKLAKHYNDMPKNNMRISLKDVNHLTYIYNMMSEKQRKDAESFPNFPEPPTPPRVSHNQEMKELPPPPSSDKIIKVPTPPTPLEHVIKMAKKGAVFYYEGKQISAEKAINVVEANRSLNIDSRRDSKSGKPMIKISKDPIVVNP